MTFKPYQFVTVNLSPPFYAIVLSHRPESQHVQILRLEEQPFTALVRASECSPVNNIFPFDQLSRFIVAANRRNHES